jgi:DNA-binding response OmpR family regulator
MIDSSGRHVMEKKKILVVDDEVNQGLLYEQELTDEGYAVDVANSGQRALALVKDTNYDLVVLDIGMPYMDGLETLGKMLSMDNRLPVILNTAYPSYKDNFMSWAADAYVVKSSDLTELKEKIKESLAKRK